MEENGPSLGWGMGVNRRGSGQSRAAEGRAAAGRGQSPGQPESRENEPFALRTYVVGGLEVKKLHIDGR